MATQPLQQPGWEQKSRFLFTKDRGGMANSVVPRPCSSKRFGHATEKFCSIFWSTSGFFYSWIFKVNVHTWHISNENQLPADRQLLLVSCFPIFHCSDTIDSWRVEKNFWVAAWRAVILLHWEEGQGKTWSQGIDVSTVLNSLFC